MSVALALLAASAAVSVDLGAVMDRLETCVMAKTDFLAPANEPANVTVEAALAACLTERANFRTATKQFLGASSPSLSAHAASEVEQKTYDLGISSVRDRALVRLVTARAISAGNK